MEASWRASFDSDDTEGDGGDCGESEIEPFPIIFIVLSYFF